MANQIRLKRGSGSSPSTSDLVVGEVAVRTDTGQLFTKKDDGNIEEIGAQSGIADGSITNVKVNASAAIAGSKISPTFTSDITIQNSEPILNFTDTTSGSSGNPDYRLHVNGGSFSIQDATNSNANRFVINNVGNITVPGNFDVLGNIATTGTINANGNRIYISGVDPALDLTDTNNNSDFRLQNDNGTLKVKDQSNSNAVRFSIASDGTVDVAGNLDVGAGVDVIGAITATSHIDIPDSAKIKLGTGDDLNIFHDGANSYLQNITGNLILKNNATDYIIFKNSDASTEVVGNLDVGAGLDVTGDTDISGELTVGANDLTIANNYLRFKNTGVGRFDHNVVGQNINFRVSNSSSLDTTPLVIKAAGIDVTGNIAVTGTVDGVDIAALNTTVGTKLPLAGGTLTGNLTISHDHPRIIFNDTSNNPDYLIDVNAGHFLIYDSTNSANRLLINSDGHIDLLGNVDITNGLDVTGNITATGNLDLPNNGNIALGNNDEFTLRYNGSSALLIYGSNTFFATGDTFRVVNSGISENIIWAKANAEVELYYNNSMKFETTNTGVYVNGNVVVTGTVDGRDVATDGTKLDGIESNATADQTASEILTLIKTVDGSGSGLDADLLDGISSASFLRSDAADTCSGKITFSDGIVLPTTGDGIKFGPGDAANDDAHIEWLGGSNTGYLRISTSDDSDSSGQNEYIEFGDYPTVNKGGTFTQHVRIARDRFLVRTGSNTISQADRLNIASDGKVDIYGNLEVGNFTRSTNGYGVGSTTVLSASRELQNVTLNSSSVTATTQSAGNNTTRIATTAFVSTAINNLINGAPAALDTLNELAAAMNDNASFSTTVTNSLATKMPLAGGEFTGNITFSGSQTVDGRDLSVDGSKLDGIESGATADQSASEILTLIKTVDGSGSGLDADLLDGISSGSFVRSDANDSITGHLTITNDSGLKIYTSTNAAGAKINFSDQSSRAQNGTLTYKHADGQVTTTGGNSNDGWIFEGTENRTVVKVVGDIEATSNIYGAGANITALNASNISSGTIAAARLPNHSAALLTSGTISDARLPSSISSDITGNSATATKLATARTIAGVSFDGSANISLNNSNITNGAGYITSSQTAGGFSAGNASNLNSGTVAAARLPQQEHGTSIVGNFGQWQGHSTYSNFNTEPAYWGWNFIQGSTNAPNTTSSQWYRCRLSLGSEYGKGSDSGDYSLEMALPRYSHSAAGVLHIRTIEAGSEGSWTTVGNNASLITTGTLSTARLSASDVLTLIKTVDGAGSGLDADTLDGISSGSFLRSDAADVMSQSSQGTATLDVRNTGGAGSGTGTGAIIAKFIGDSDAIEVRNIAAGDYGIYNTQQDNGLELYDGGGGVRIIYGGAIAVEFDSGNAYGDFKGVPTVNGTSLVRTSDTIASATNADTVDSLHASSFVRSDAADTASGDITFSGGGGAVTIAANSDIRFTNGSWTGDTCKIQHHGSRLYIVGGSDGIRFREGGTDRWNIDGSGHFVPSTNNTYNIGSSSLRVANLYVNDMHFSNKGKTNDVDGSWGDWTLQEGEEDIFMINNRSGKKFKIAMTPV